MGVFQVGIFQGGSYPGWEFSRWELSWVRIYRVGVILDGNCLWWEFSGWELSRGNHPGENFRSGSFPSTDGVGGLLVFRKTFLIESVMIVSL